MTARTFMILAVLLALGTSACQQEQKDTLGNAKEAVSDLAASAENVVSAVGDLSKDKVEDLAKIAVALENAPAKAEEMLKEHGWTRAEFDKMVTAVRNNEELNKVFEAAKKLAQQH